MNTTSVQVTAGLGGFLVVFCLGLTVWLLGRDLTRRLRRMRLTEEARLREQDGASADVTARAADPGAEHGEERGRPV